MKKVVKSVKKRFKKITKSVKKHPLISIGATLLVLVLIGGVTTLALVGGGDDSSDDTTAGTSSGGGGDGSSEPDKPKKKKLKEAPPAPVRSGAGTLDVARREGRLALAQARGRIKKPNGISVTVSAAPKQPVTVDYQLTCYRLNGRTGDTKVANKRYTTTPPATRDLPLPLPGADECTVSVSAQLTEGSGRIKVTVKAS